MRFLPFVIPIVLAVYCWVELAQSHPDEVRALPRWLWALLIAIPLFGAIGWLVSGRPNGEPARPVRHATTPAARPLAPDDDPEFLRNLKIDPPPDA